MSSDEITISITVDNSDKCILECLEKVAGQKGIGFEVIIFMNSVDRTVEEYLESLHNQKFRTVISSNPEDNLENHKYIKNNTNSPFVLFMESNHFLLPGALKKLYDRISSSNELALVHSYYFCVDKNSNIVRESFHKLWDYFYYDLERDKKYINEVLFNNDDLLINGTKIIRRNCLNKVQDVSSKYEFLLDILNNDETALLEEFIYYKINDIWQDNSYSKNLSLHNLTKKLHDNRKYFRTNKSLKLHQKKYNFYKAFLSAFFTYILSNKLCVKISDGYESSYKYVRGKIIKPLMQSVYRSLTTNFKWWTLDLFHNNRRSYGKEIMRTGYFIWQFPILSETFIQREINALLSKDNDLMIFSEHPSEGYYINDFKDNLSKHTIYLEPSEKKNKHRLKKYKHYFFLRNPLLYAYLFLYVLFHKYHNMKDFNLDKKVFSRAVFLAGAAKDNKIDHLHSPWADKSAFICLLASRLLGITYSLQARAFDIHRTTDLYGMKEKLGNAKFIVTNTVYNVNRIRSILGNGNNYKLYQIYNGLNLEQFKTRRRKNISSPARLLTVARLSEEKGIDYLLKTCAILKDKGIDFVWDIIGGTEDLGMNYYIKLKKMQRDLGLTDRVQFCGAMPFEQVIAAYKKADIFILPSIIAEDGTRDIIPNAVIEAMAMKLPVISTNITGIPEIIESGADGILVPPNDEHKLYKEIINLIRDDKLRNSIAENARKKVEVKFDITKNIELYCDLFSHALDNS